MLTRGPRNLAALALDYDNKFAATVSGFAAPGETVSLRVDGVERGQAAADQAGRFVVALSQPLTAGAHDFELVGPSGDVRFSAEIGAPTPPAGAPYAAQRQAAAWRVDWITPGGGEQTTLILDRTGAAGMSVAHARGMARRAANAGPPTPGFSFWQSMAELVRLVLRSRAQGLRTRLAVALGLVLVGKWTGVYAPVLIGQAIDAASKGKGAPETLFAVFVGLAAGWVLLRFISNATPLLRDAIFTPVSQQALARSAEETLRPRAVALAELPPGQADRRRRPRHRARRQLHRHLDRLRRVQPRPDDVRAGDGRLRHDQPLLRPAGAGDGRHHRRSTSSSPSASRTGASATAAR